MPTLKSIKNIVVEGKYGKDILADIFFEDNYVAKPVVIYAHGFNGFKDWGNFDLVAFEFAEAGFVFVKFNFSHNGTTIDHPEEFVDLESFGNNNYTKELDDLETVIGWILSDHEQSVQIDQSKLYLIGHSKGGGIVLLKAVEDNRVKAVVTWASVAECKTPWGNWSFEKMSEWKESGVQYVTNSRTNQDLPLYYQLYEDYKANESRLNIQNAISHLQIPVLICHGSQDVSVSVEQAYLLHDQQPKSELFLVESDHVFGRKHPWRASALPEPMQLIVNQTIAFFSRSV